MWVEGFWHNVCLTAHFINIALQSRIWTKMCQVYLKAECSSFLKKSVLELKKCTKDEWSINPSFHFANLEAEIEGCK